MEQMLIVTMLSSLACLVMLSAAVAMIFTSRIFEKAYKKQEELAEDAMKKSAEEERKSRAMDEGFANLMQYSVRGQDGFGGGQ